MAGEEIVESKEENVNNLDALLPFKIASKSSKRIAFDRRMAIMNGIVKKEGLPGAYDRIKSLAEHYKVGERRIYADLKWIKGNFKASDLRELAINLNILRDNSVQKSLKLLNNAIGSDQERDAIKVALETIQKVRQEMEAWGEKPKIADVQKIEFESQFTKEEKEAEIKRLLGK